MGTRSRRLSLVAVLSAVAILASAAPAAAQTLTPQTMIDIASPVVVKEPGAAGTIDFHVVLRHRPTQTVTVRWTTARDTATDGVDYIAEVGVRTFSPGRLTADEGPIRIQLLPTDPFVGERRFNVNLVDVPTANASIGVRHGVATIVPRGPAGEGPTVTIAGGVEVVEGNSGTVVATLPVRLSQAIAQPVEVRYRTSDGTAIAATGDYDSVTAGVVTIPAGEDQASVPITVNGDTLAELNEWFEVVLTTTTNATVASANSGHRGRVWILNDDGPHLTIGDVTQLEGADGELTPFRFTVRLHQPAQGATVTVDYRTVDGSGNPDDPPAEAAPLGEVDGGDYMPTAGTLQFAPGQSERTVTVRVIGDNWPEPTEHFSVLLSNAQTSSVSSGVTLLKTRGVGTIVNDDGPDIEAQDVELHQPGQAPATVEVPVSIDGDTSRVSGDYRVHYRTVGGSAVAGEHYEHATGALTIPRDQAGGAIELIVLPTQPGPTRELTVELFHPDYGRLVGEATTVTILGHPDFVDESGTETSEANPGGGDTGGAGLVRTAGIDRIGTAVAVSREHWERSDVAVLATAGNYPDALAAVPVAAGLAAPMLLTHAHRLPDEVAAELARLQVEHVWIMGGVSAVSSQVEEALQAAGYDTTRLSGRDRFATAAQAAHSVGLPDSGEVALALGAHSDEARAWPDALTAGALAASPDQLPVLLTLGGRLPEVTAGALAELGASHVVLLGGEAAISGAVQQRLVELGYEVTRRAGSDRYATSAAVAADALARWGDRKAPVVFATGENFPDGLAAGALAARLDGILVLVPKTRLELAAEVRTFLDNNRDRLGPGVVVGGPAAISESVHDELRAELGAT